MAFREGPATLAQHGAQTLQISTGMRAVSGCRQLLSTCTVTPKALCTVVLKGSGVLENGLCT